MAKERSLPLPEAAASGNRRSALVSLRDLLARVIAETDSARDVAALSRQLTDVLAQIEEMDAAKPEQEGTPLDELRKRRAAREASA